MALSIDGIGTATPSTVTTGATVALTTTVTGDIICVFIGSEVSDTIGSPAANVASVTASGMTFARRGSAVKIDQNSLYHYSSIELWWAFSSGTFTGNITVNWNKEIDDAVLIAFGVTGFTGTSYQSAPWDPDSSLPAVATNLVDGNPVIISGVNTTNADTMVLGLFGTVGGSMDFNPAQGGFNLISQTGNGGADNQFQSIAEYHVFSTTQSGLTVALGTAPGIGWMGIADALSMTGATAGGPTAWSGAALLPGAGALAVPARLRQLATTQFAGSGTLLVDGVVNPIILRLGSTVLDGGLSYLDANADEIYVCSRQPNTYTEATSTYAIGNKSLSVGTVFGAPAAASSPTGRKVTGVSVTDGSVTATGNVYAWAVVDSVNSLLLASGPLGGPKAVINGQKWTLEQLIIHLPSL